MLIKTMSQFAGTVCVQAKDLKDYLKILPKELTIEIFSYLNMGIILTLYDQFKPIILKCLKRERYQQRKPFASFFNDLSKQELIRLILETESINKMMIMNAYGCHRRELIKKQNLQKIKEEMQKVLLGTLKVGDVVMTSGTWTLTSTYLIIKKCKKSVRGIFAYVYLPRHEGDFYTLVIPPRQILHTIGSARFYIYDLEKTSVIKEAHYKNCKAVNSSSFVHVLNRVGGNIHVGTFPTGEAVAEIDKYYKTITIIE